MGGILPCLLSRIDWPIWRLGLVGILVSLTGCSFNPVGNSLADAQPPPAVATPTPAISPAELNYQIHSLANSTVYTLTIPTNTYHVSVAVTDTLTTVEEVATQTGAIAAINGGFFDPVNQKTTSFIQINGELVADPRQNERLINNPDLTSYLDQILNRSEFRRYRCGHQTNYAIALHSTPLPDGCQIIDSLGAGPQLLPSLTSEAEGFVETRNEQVVRDAIGSLRPNARSAIAITASGDLILAMVAQMPASSTASGLSLPELAAFLREMGAVSALNLDGGSSSTFYYNGEVITGKFDETGAPVERAVKSVLLVKPM